jgi:aspartate/methionine/tyrosine aminotransferase
MLCDTFLSVSTPLQTALPELLALAPDLHEPIRDRLRESARLLHRMTQGTGMRFHGLAGGWCGLLEIPGMEDDEAFAIELVEQAGVLVQPGYLYDFEAEHFLVVSLLTPPGPLEAGMREILARLPARP